MNLYSLKLKQKTLIRFNREGQHWADEAVGQRPIIKGPQYTQLVIRQLLVLPLNKWRYGPLKTIDDL